jgi:hypothetical protein
VFRTGLVGQLWERKRAELSLSKTILDLSLISQLGTRAMT